MVVSSNYNLIPYPDHHYPIQLYLSENALANQHSGQESIERHDRFRQPHLNFKTGTIHIDIPNNRYDISLCLQYSDVDQVGHLIDIYA
jgi:hypothetical protein